MKNITRLFLVVTVAYSDSNATVTTRNNRVMFFMVALLSVAALRLSRSPYSRVR